MFVHPRVFPVTAMAAIRPVPAKRAARDARARARSSSEEPAHEARVHGALLEAVMSHQLPPGARLVEMPLCEAFGVSRSLLRRVLVRLANERVVELNHNRGASVAKASPQETRHVFQARRLIETALLRELPAPDRRTVDALRALVDREERAYATHQWSELIRLSGEFHLQLAAGFGNEELTTVLRGLVARTSLMIALYEMPGRGVCSFDEHRMILTALAKDDAASAARHMAEHLEHCEMKLRPRMQPLEIDFARLFGSVRSSPRKGGPRNGAVHPDGKGTKRAGESRPANSRTKHPALRRD